LVRGLSAIVGQVRCSLAYRLLRLRPRGMFDIERMLRHDQAACRGPRSNTADELSPGLSQVRCFADAVVTSAFGRWRSTYGMAPLGSIIRWIMDGWLTELTSKAAAKRSLNELSATASQSNVVRPMLVFRLRKLQPNTPISLADVNAVSSGALLSATASSRRRSALYLRAIGSFLASFFSFL